MSAIGDYLWEWAPAWWRRGTDEARHLTEALSELLMGAKEGIFRARRAWLVQTAPEVVLPVHAEFRRMPRYPAESVEGWRARILDAFLLHQEGGTTPGIERALTALGFPGSTVQALYGQGTATYDATYAHDGEIHYTGDPRAFEFDVQLVFDEALTAQQLANLRAEIGRRKSARDRFNAFQLEMPLGEDAGAAPQDDLMTVTVSLWAQYDGEFKHDESLTYDALSEAQQEV